MPRAKQSERKASKRRLEQLAFELDNKKKKEVPQSQAASPSKRRRQHRARSQTTAASISACPNGKSVQRKEEEEEEEEEEKTTGILVSHNAPKLDSYARMTPTDAIRLLVNWESNPRGLSPQREATIVDVERWLWALFAEFIADKTIDSANLSGVARKLCTKRKSRNRRTRDTPGTGNHFAEVLQYVCRLVLCSPLGFAESDFSLRLDSVSDAPTYDFLRVLQAYVQCGATFVMLASPFLGRAAFHRQHDVVRYLLNLRCSHKPRFAAEALEHAIDTGNIKGFRMLLHRVPRIEAPFHTLLDLCVKKTQIKMMELLLKKGADPTVHGACAFESIFRADKTDFLVTLLRFGPKLSIYSQPRAGNGHMGQRKLPKPACLRILLEHGVVIDPLMIDFNDSPLSSGPTQEQLSILVSCYQGSTVDFVLELSKRCIESRKCNLLRTVLETNKLLTRNHLNELLTYVCRRELWANDLVLTLLEHGAEASAQQCAPLYHALRSRTCPLSVVLTLIKASESFHEKLFQPLARFICDHPGENLWGTLCACHNSLVNGFNQQQHHGSSETQLLEHTPKPTIVQMLESTGFQGSVDWARLKECASKREAERVEQPTRGTSRKSV